MFSDLSLPSLSLKLAERDGLVLLTPLPGRPSGKNEWPMRGLKLIPFQNIAGNMSIKLHRKVLITVHSIYSGTGGASLAGVMILRPLVKSMRIAQMQLEKLGFAGVLVSCILPCLEAPSITVILHKVEVPSHNAEDLFLGADTFTNVEHNILPVFSIDGASTSSRHVNTKNVQGSGRPPQPQAGSISFLDFNPVPIFVDWVKFRQKVSLQDDAYPGRAGGAVAPESSKTLRQFKNVRPSFLVMGFFHNHEIVIVEQTHTLFPFIFLFVGFGREKSLSIIGATGKVPMERNTAGRAGAATTGSSGPRGTGA